VQIFGHWTDMVTDLIRATPEEDVIRRDIYDRPPIFKWTEVRAPHSDLINEIGMQDMQILVFAISSFKFEWKGWPTISIGTIRLRQVQFVLGLLRSFQRCTFCRRMHIQVGRRFDICCPLHC
jgi:hypothetical protein